MDVKPWDAVVEESEDFFYNVVVPSPLMGCEHFGSCSGCWVDKKVGDVDVIKLAKCFFSSTSVRSGWMDVKPWDAVVEESDNFF
mmetsp:Transcript_18592/g.31747  ORF Transcript_18592/g.31747 Transcript_18592/m.31747 type:complete len:84 (+) Transcript_18592:23-274(+)